MGKRRVWILAILVGCLVATASLEALPFGKKWAGDAQLPRPYGIGFDIFAMDHGYIIKDLSFDVPGLPATSAEGIDVENSITELNVKVDAWIFPFLNVFGIIGEIDGTTRIDLRNASIPLPFNNLQVSYDGTVFGGGATLAAGTERFFGSLTYTYTETDLGGDFESDVTAEVWMPKVGLAGNGGAFWVGAMFLTAEEAHRGRTTVPILGTVNFDILLEEEEELSYTVGGSVNWGEHFTFTLEGGFGDRTTTLMSAVWRF